MVLAPEGRPHSAPSVSSPPGDRLERGRPSGAGSGDLLSWGGRSVRPRLDSDAALRLKKPQLSEVENVQHLMVCRRCMPLARRGRGSGISMGSSTSTGSAASGQSFSDTPTPSCMRQFASRSRPGRCTRSTTNWKLNWPRNCAGRSRAPRWCATPSAAVRRVPSRSESRAVGPAATRSASAAITAGTIGISLPTSRKRRASTRTSSGDRADRWAASPCRHGVVVRVGRPRGTG